MILDRDAIRALETATRRAIADGLDTTAVLEVVRDLTEEYEQYADPALTAREDLANTY